MPWAERARSCSWGEGSRSEGGEGAKSCTRLGKVGPSPLPLGGQAPWEIREPEGRRVPKHPLPIPWLQAWSLRSLEQRGWDSPTALCPGWEAGEGCTQHAHSSGCNGGSPSLILQ